MQVSMDASFFASAPAPASASSSSSSSIAAALCARCRKHGAPGSGFQKTLVSWPVLTAFWQPGAQRLPSLCGKRWLKRLCPSDSLFIHWKANVIVHDFNFLRFCNTSPFLKSISIYRLNTIARKSPPIAIFLERKRGYHAKVGSFGKNDKDILSTFELEKSVPPSKNSSNGIYVLLLLNLATYIADHWLKFGGVKSLYLYHSSPSWYQFITSLFCHLNWSHLSSNLFFMYIFGKLVEEEGGSFGLWTTYIICGIGANLVSWLLLPPSVVSIGASGAVFGLFAVSVLIRISLDWRKLLEVMILGQFVVEKVMEAARSSAQMGGNLYGSTAINHIAHFSGALVGVALIWALSRLSSGVPAKKENLKKNSHDL